MVDEVTTLGISVDTKDVKAADKDLQKLAKTSEKTEKATDGLAKSTKKATDGLTAEAKAATEAKRATDAIAVSTKNVTNRLNEELAALKRTDREQKIYNEQKRAGATATSKQGREIERLVNAINKEKTAIKAAKDRQKAHNLAIKENEAFNRRKAAASKLATDAAIREKLALDRLTASQRLNTKATSAMGNAWRAAAGFLTAFIGIQGARFLKELSDEAKKINNLLKQVTDSQGNLNAVLRELSGIANESRSSLLATSQLYQRLAISADDLGLSQRELLDITSTITKSFALSGATATEASGAIRQLSQGLAAGALRGDEFNSVAEQAPIIMRAISKETGLAIGDLREFAATGGITAEIVTNALQGMEDEVDKAFAATTATFEQQTTIIRNELVLWADENENLEVTLGAVGQALGFFAVGATAVLDIVLMVTSGIIQLIRFLGDLPRTLGLVKNGFNRMNKPISESVDVVSLLWEGIGLVENALLSMIQIVVQPTVFGFKLLVTTIKGVINTLIDAAVFVQEYTGASEELIAKTKKLRLENKPFLQQMKDFNKRFDIARDSVDAYIDEIVEQRKESEKTTGAVEEYADATAKATRENKKLQSQLKAVDTAFADEIFALLATERELALYNKLTKAGTTANTDLGKQILLTNDIIFDQKDALAATKQEAKDLATTEKKAATDAQKAYEESHKAITDLFFESFDNWEGGLSGFVDNAVDLIKSMLARMAAEFAASKVLEFFGFGTGSGGGLGSVIGGGGGGGNILGSILGGGSGGGGGISGGITDIAEGFRSGGVSGGFGAISSAASGVGSSISGLGGSVRDALGLGTNVSAAGPTQGNVLGGSGLAGAAVNIGAGFIGAELGGAAVDAFGGKEAQSSIAATVGGAIGSIFGPIGTGVGAFIGSLVDSLFGSGKGDPFSLFTSKLDLDGKSRRVKDNDAAGIISSAFGDFQFRTSRDLLGSQAEADQIFSIIDGLAGLENELATGLDASQIETVRSALSGDFSTKTRNGVDIEGFFRERFGTIASALGGSIQDFFDVPGFANGGSFGGGVAMVGEQGRELIATGPARVLSNRDMVAANSGNAQQIENLTAEVKRGNVAIAVLLTKQLQLEKTWTITGLKTVPA